MLRLTRWRNC
uniref:Uncharacterized protein n=1 Tax=Rhizophora mucronata TaxID=61149 RepID=A0A2P2JJH8_RHIMU